MTQVSAHPWVLRSQWPGWESFRIAAVPHPRATVQEGAPERQQLPHGRGHWCWPRRPQVPVADSQVLSLAAAWQVRDRERPTEPGRGWHTIRTPRCCALGLHPASSVPKQPWVAVRLLPSPKRKPGRRWQIACQPVLRLLPVPFRTWDMGRCSCCGPERESAQSYEQSGLPRCVLRAGVWQRPGDSPYLSSCLQGARASQQRDTQSWAHPCPLQ